MVGFETMLVRYARWLHTGWPAAQPEKLPIIDREGRTSVPGVWIAGDLAGIPLLKFALESGSRVARAIHTEILDSSAAAGDVLDLVIVGAGVAGMSAALEARRLGLRYAIVESSEPFSTLVNMPAHKPIFTYPSGWVPESGLSVSAPSKESLIQELRSQVERAGVAPRPGRALGVDRQNDVSIVRLEGGAELRGRHVLVAIGRSGDFRKLGVPGESLDKVFNRLHDPKDHRGRRVLVVGGGDSALECALALTCAGANVILCHRGPALARPKPANVEAALRISRGSAEEPGERPSQHGVSPASPWLGPRAGGGGLEIRLRTRVRSIAADHVVLEEAGREEVAQNDVVFVMIGRTAPLAFLRRSGIRIAGDWTRASIAGLVLFLAFCAWLYDWKSGGVTTALWSRLGWFPFDLPQRLHALGGSLGSAARDPATPLGTLAISAAAPAFWYTLAYSIVVVVFGVRRIRRRRTPYVTAQTLCLLSIQVLPLFFLPELILPCLHHNHRLPAGLEDALFPAASYGHGREFWRAYGLILAWPLDVYNVFTAKPLPWWLAISAIQTFVLIPLAVLRWGKGAYCGWICSCGALAETLGDTQRHKMPHGPGWNRLNLAGQGILAVALGLLALRVAGWMLPSGNALDIAFEAAKERYKWGVDVFLAGVLGYGLYFWFSGRVWCRFFCPLAALMHVYARLGRFAIVPEKARCISCGVCTAVCHQGIDVMSFANQGLPMTDPQCVRCSACVHDCPTGVLQFGQVRGGAFIGLDRLASSPVRIQDARGEEPAHAAGG